MTSLKKKTGFKNKSILSKGVLIFALSALSASIFAAGSTHPATSIDPRVAAAASGSTPVTNGNSTADIKNATSIEVDGLDDKCTAHTKDYSEEYSKMFDKGPSLMSQCGLGKLMDFDMLKLFDPLGTLLDAMQGAVCGWVNEAYTPFQKSWNRRVSGANQWINDRNRGYSNWVDSRASAVYDNLYASYNQSKTKGLDDIGYPYDTEFSDPSAVPAGSPQAAGNGYGPQAGSGSSVSSEGTFNSGTYGDSDVIVIDNSQGPLIIDSSQSTDTYEDNFTNQSNSSAINPNKELQEVFNLFKK
jgi:hypothetical protein